jgi:CBS domain-containing protein
MAGLPGIHTTALAATVEIFSAARSFPRRRGGVSSGLPAAGGLHRAGVSEAAMRVYEVMSRKVETVKPAVLASEAKTRMRQRHIHHLVVTEGSQLQGIVSDRDLGGPKLPKALGKWTVGDLMTEPVVTVTTRTPIRRAASLMKGRSIGSLVVTSPNGKVAGIVTVADLLDLLAKRPEHASNRDLRKARDGNSREDE